MRAELIGDSHMNGAPGQRLAALVLAAAPDLQVLRDGRAGWSVGDWVEYLEKSPLQVDSEVALCLVMLGHNHKGAGAVELAQDAYDLAVGLEIAYPAAKLAWIGPPNSPQVNPELSNRTLQVVLASQARWFYVDSFPITADLAYMADGVHLAGSQGAAWAERAWQELQTQELERRQVRPSRRALWSLVPFGLFVGWRAVRALKRLRHGR